MIPVAGQKKRRLKSLSAKRFQILSALHVKVCVTLWEKSFDGSDLSDLSSK